MPKKRLQKKSGSRARANSRESTNEKETARIRSANGSIAGDQSEIQSDWVGGAENIDQIAVTAEELARIFACTQSRIRQLSEKRIVVKKGRKKYDLCASITAYVNYLKNFNESAECKRGEEIRLTKLRADEKEMQLQIQAGEYWPRDFVEQRLMQISATLVATLKGAVPRIAGKFPQHCGIYALLRDEFNEVRNQFADGLRSIARDFELQAKGTRKSE